MGSGWIRAKDALARVAKDYQSETDAKRALVGRVRAGLVKARCLKARSIEQDTGHESEHDNYDVPRRFWERLLAPSSREREDWVNGDFRTWETHERYSAKYFYVIDVQFSETDILAPAGGPVEPRLAISGAPDTRQVLADAEIRRFAEVYQGVFGAKGTEIRAVAAIRACYPDHRVPRDAFLAYFRAIRGGVPPGRKGNAEK